MNKHIRMTRLTMLAFFVITWIAASSFILSSTNFEYVKNKKGSQNFHTPSKHKIQIALLLDTSNSMDGLIEQAKSQLWNIVNELSKAKCDGEPPSLEIALYEYGNDHLNGKEGFVRQVLPLITDLDQISTKLFELRTNGGQEYCGTVIDKATKQLEWSSGEKDIRLIFIAGNEPFTQGNLNYEIACGNARQKGITINTIYCGNYDEGLRTSWKSGALIGGGDYMSIQQDRKTVYIATPYDDTINALNIQFNDTYHYYGITGKQKKEEQVRADSMAVHYSKSNLAARNSIKASSYYFNAHWDLIDASKDKNFSIEKIDKKTLPPNLQKMSNAELEKYIKEEKIRREKVKSEIAAYKIKRDDYLKNHQKTGEESVESTMIKAVKKQAETKNYSW